MLNLSRQQAVWLLFTVIAVLFILFIMLIWLLVRPTAPALAPLALAQAIGMLS